MKKKTKRQIKHPRNFERGFLMSCEEILSAMTFTVGSNPKTRKQLGCLLMDKATEVLRYTPTVH